MRVKSSRQRYGAVSIGLHWLMLILLIAVYACMELREFFPKGSGPREALKTWHFMLGLTVLVLALLRLLARVLGPAAPPIEPLPPRWQRRVATATHALLYLLMLGMPVAGWLILSAAGKPIPFFGLQLPALIGVDKGIAEVIEEIHEAGATIGYGLIGIHAAAALFHHYLLRDNTLIRMLPGRE